MSENNDKKGPGEQPSCPTCNTKLACPTCNAELEEVELLHTPSVRYYRCKNPKQPHGFQIKTLLGKASEYSAPLLGVSAAMIIGKTVYRTAKDYWAGTHLDPGHEEDSHVAEMPETEEDSGHGVANVEAEGHWPMDGGGHENYEMADHLGHEANAPQDDLGLPEDVDELPDDFDLEDVV
jgi:hypothetical protein